MINNKYLLNFQNVLDDILEFYILIISYKVSINIIFILKMDMFIFVFLQKCREEIVGIQKIVFEEKESYNYFY